MDIHPLIPLQDKEARLASVIEGRKDRGKYGAQKGRMNPHASTTNKEKARHKIPSMIKYRSDVMAKKYLSMRDRQVCLSTITPAPHTR
jgi:protein SDA1